MVIYVRIIKQYQASYVYLAPIITWKQANTKSFNAWLGKLIPNGKHLEFLDGDQKNKKGTLVFYVWSQIFKDIIG